MRFREIEYLDALILRLVAVTHLDLLLTELAHELREQSCFERGDMGRIPQGEASLRLNLGKAKLSCGLVALSLVAWLTSQRQVVYPI
jgi:hypothetical protein